MKLVFVMNSWHSPHGRALPEVGRRTLVMGILNVTPDSFSDGGELPAVPAVLDRAAHMLAAGADLLDIGGESTRPGARPVGEAEELGRVLPAIRALRERWPAVPLSIDTFKPAVAVAAIEAGADIINDVWGLMHGLTGGERTRLLAALDSPASLPVAPMAATAARLGCPVVLMHNRPDRAYREFWTDVLRDLRLSLALAQRAGIASHQIWLDPGFGFAKDVAQNLEILRHLGRVVGLGYPVLVGTSRKSTLGTVLGTTVADRLEGTAATSVWAIQQGCAMIRVHDVGPLVRCARMADAIKAGLTFQPTEPWTN
jgi:dihydropteroate synthase